ncbi:MAG TPA: 23S rRNA (adenine(2503)-C(2))-methyltransferase RlmN, partial [Chlamydiales bacterium]|nr:23S rRNA (adenine(2503)-C(2))-methyltransferase RlmN [Chlamydiales bacterium]
EGLIRNLEVGEIFAQVYHINQWLLQRGQKVTHIVYMGMGEPFRNYDNVVKSIRYLIDPEMMGFSQRRITVSTVGVVEGIKQYSEEGLKTNLVLSLHAPNQRLRQKLIPYARQYSLESILDAMDGYAEKTGRDITYEYTLIKDLNDGEDEAKELVQLLKLKQCTVNLIPYNPVIGLKIEKPDPQSVRRFREILTDGDIVNTCRYTKGDDIAAACGQLAMQHKL